jgi:hypothetical protein
MKFRSGMEWNYTAAHLPNASLLPVKWASENVQEEGGLISSVFRRNLLLNA